MTAPVALRALAVSVVFLGALTGCGSESAPPVDARMLQGHTYVATSVTGRELVADTTIELAFEAGSMSATAGCNTMFGAFDVDRGVLSWADDVASTMMACPEDLTGQDDWVRGLLVEGAGVTADGSSLTLESGDVTIDLERRT